MTTIKPTKHQEFSKKSFKMKPLDRTLHHRTTYCTEKHKILTLLLLLLSHLAASLSMAFQSSLFGGESTSAPTTKARLCVTNGDYNECLQMSNVSNGSLTCVKARDRYECMNHIIDDRADIVNLNNEELYLAGRLYNLEPFAMEQYNGDTQHYKSVAIINTKANINSIADLRGKRSCHGSFNSTQGWNIPIGLLLATLTMTPDCRGEMYSVAKFFDQSCAPGPWSSNGYIDGELKRLHPSLCAACQNASTCSASDEFAGEEGALRCLLSGFGQVAFTSAKVVERFLSEDWLDRRLLSNFAYLCLDGSKVPLNSTPCEWAHKPTNVFVTSPSTKNAGQHQQTKEFYLQSLQQLFFRFVPYKPSWWRMRSLFSDWQKVTQILPVPAHLQQWDKYLGNYISSIEKPLPGCEPNSVRFCTTSVSEELKCLDLQKAAFTQRIRPEIDCKRRASKLDCMEMVAKREADLVGIDYSALHEAPASVMQLLEPVAVSQPAEADYAVALVRADSGIKFLYQLGGRRSCHASFGDTASWLAPLAVLTERSLLEQQVCNKADQMADFFAGSCLPGAADLRVNNFRSGSEKLCALCKGQAADGQHQCERSPSERYFGQTGALRCLIEGAGEVAFMSLSSLLQNVDGRSSEPWARTVPLALDSRNFRLICRNGPNMLLADYERCHLAKLPGRIYVSHRFASRDERLGVRRLLVWLEEKFLAEEGEMFRLFAGARQLGASSTANETDLLFDDSTRKISPTQLSDANTFEQLNRFHFDPSFSFLPVGQREASCRVVLTNGRAGLSAPPLALLIGCLLLSLLPGQRLGRERALESSLT